MNQFLPLRDLFVENTDFAWDLLEAQCQVYQNKNIKLSQVTHLTALYMKAIQFLNSLQDSRESFFIQQMNKMLTEQHVIKILNTVTCSKKCQLQNKRIDLTQRLHKESEKNVPKKLRKMLEEQKQKEEKYIQQVNEIVKSHDKKLEERIWVRKNRVSILKDQQQSFESSSKQEDHRFNPEHKYHKSSTDTTIENEFK